MISRIKIKLRRMNLTSKIRLSYFLIMIPVLGFVLLTFINMMNSSHRYDSLISSVSEASKFSLDFQKDFDYETYLVIVGNKLPEESDWDELLSKASDVVEELTLVTDTPNNLKTLETVSKYLTNLNIYKNRIVDNLNAGNLYEENMEIWENDIQIVTALVRETMITYIYDETCDLQAARDAYQQFYRNMIRIIITALVLLAVILAVISYYIPIGITRNLRELCNITDRIAAGDLTVQAKVEGGEEVEALSTSMNAMIIKINELIDQVTEEQKRLRKSEFELLQAQINPHFLYNTLDAIMWLIEAGEREQAVSMVRNLSEFFRTSLNQGKDIITIEEELKHVRSYLEIQKTRYQDILDYEIDVPETLYGYTIPKITLQPLVENALYHGIKNKRGKGMIKITGQTEDEKIVITVSDNGAGMSPERLKEVDDAIENGIPSEGHIYGVYNVNERIKLNEGDGFGLRFESELGEGTRVKVILPENSSLIIS